MIASIVIRGYLFRDVNFAQSPARPDVGAFKKGSGGNSALVGESAAAKVYKEVATV